MDNEKTVRRPKGTGTILTTDDGRFIAKIVLNGKQKKKICKSEAEANRTLNKWIREHKENGMMVTNKMSVKTALTKWLTEVKVNELKPTSYDRLESTINTHIIPSIGNIQFGSLTGSDIQNLLNSIDRQGRSYSTIKKVYDALHSYYTWAVNQRLIVYNPTAGITIPQSKKSGAKKRKKKNGDIKFYTVAEQDKIIAAATAKYPNGTPIYRFGYAVPFMLNTGIRLGELLGLEWDRDVDFDNRTIKVENSLVIIKNRDPNSEKKTRKLEQDSTKSESGERPLYLNDEALDALQKLHKITGKFRHVIATKSGESVQPSNIERMLRTACERAGVKYLGVHALRHSFATNLIRNGVDIKIVSELLGHSDIGVTYNTYVHFIDEQKKEAMIRIGGRSEKADTKDDRDQPKS